MNCTNAATNPTLQTTNYEKLSALNHGISDATLATTAVLYNTPPFAQPNLPIPRLGGSYNSIRSLTKIAEIFNDVEMHGVAGVPLVNTPQLALMQTLLQNLTGGVAVGGQQYTPQLITQGWNSRIGWNAAKQIESTVLYMNVNARLSDGSVKNITLDLKAVKPGDKILITTTVTPSIKKQIWLVEGVPKENPTYPNAVINVPVSFLKLRLTNLNTILPGDDNILNNTLLKVELQRFTQ